MQRRHDTAEGMISIRRKKVIATIVLLAVLAVVVLRWSSLALRLPDGLLTEMLSRDTPIGLSEAEVVSRANRAGCNAKRPHRNELAPNQSYPKTTSSGSSWTTCVLGSYGLIFETSVEVFYIFDGDGRLKEINVRRSTNAI